MSKSDGPQPSRKESDMSKGIDEVLVIATELARIDGFEPEDLDGGLYDLRWSGGCNPEPLGDAWNMDYLPKAERIDAALRAARGME